ncbi:hypothetical protein [Natrinema versiforme]|uniref:Uncharacterized protein n=1 Tax=Natrinema versiforme TaxID=88724 RepID=A0A4P8WJH2_9EURY|nr:hypothetical protein [Natrinema versiforme]QCS43619.1 hypothetical protein FEJ81_15135 [Natrinema versiforme]
MENYIAREWHLIHGYVGKLRWVYETDPKELDIPDDYRLNRGEHLTVFDEEEQKKRLGAEVKERGRRNPAALISSALVAVLDKADENLAFFIIELYEIDLLLSQNHVTSVLTRTGSFLQHALEDRLGVDDGLSPLITDAYEGGELSDEEVRLAQFIRQCRNDVSHNFAYFTEWSYAVHDHASICAKTLLVSLSDSWYGVEFTVGEQLSVENCLRVIEVEFGFEWLDSPATYDDDSIQDKYVTERGRG